MTDILAKANWQKLIDAANRHNIDYGFGATRPATDEEIEAMLRRAAQRGLGVDADFVTFSRYANGFGYNGLTIPCAQIDRADDFVAYNDSVSFIEIGPVYGNVDDTFHVLYPDGKFRSLGAGDPDSVLSTHDTFFEMLTDALLPAPGPSVIDSDPAAQMYASL